MDKDELLQFEAQGDFPFQFYIEKAIAKDIDDEMMLEGVASTTNIDHDKERMDQNALKAMEAAINKDGVPLRIEHQKDGDAVIGKVFKAWVDDRNQLHIRARLNKTHPVSIPLYRKMKDEGLKMGLSVGGLVKRAVKEFVESHGGVIKTFYDVALQEVSVTPRPSNYDSWVMAKTGSKDSEEAKKYWNHLGLQREFLLENSQLDYMQAFAKSVPEKAWRKVESPKLINKQDDKFMDKKEETTEETEKAVSRAEFSSLSKAVQTLSDLVSKGFESMGKIMQKAMDGDAKDTTNPDKKKPDTVGEDPEAKKGMETNAKDTTNPDKDKPTDPTQQTAKADSTETEDEKKKSVNGDETSDSSLAGKTADSSDEYKMESVQRSMKMLTDLQKKIMKSEDTKDETTKTKEDDKDETTKTKEDDKDETTKTKDDTTDETTKSHPLDMVVAALTKTMEMLLEKVEKNGQRILGFEKSFVDNIKNSPEIQETISKAMKIPGQKKSLVMGVPYMVTKDGKRHALIDVPETVSKSKKEDMKDKSFKDVYKTEYSSVRQDNE